MKKSINTSEQVAKACVAHLLLNPQKEGVKDVTVQVCVRVCVWGGSRCDPMNDSPKSAGPGSPAVRLNKRHLNRHGCVYVP